MSVQTANSTVPIFYVGTNSFQSNEKVFGSGVFQTSE